MKRFLIANSFGSHNFHYLSSDYCRRNVRHATGRKKVSQESQHQSEQENWWQGSHKVPGSYNCSRQ